MEFSREQQERFQRRNVQRTDNVVNLRSQFSEQRVQPKISNEIVSNGRTQSVQPQPRVVGPQNTKEEMLTYFENNFPCLGENGSFGGICSVSDVYDLRRQINRLLEGELFDDVEKVIQVNREKIKENIGLFDELLKDLVSKRGTPEEFDFDDLNSDTDEELF